MSNAEKNDTALRGVVEWLLAGWALMLGLMILAGGPDRWTGNRNLAVALQMPGQQYTWGAAVTVLAVGKLIGRWSGRRVLTGISSAMIGLWCYALFSTQLVAVLRDPTAGTIGPMAWLLTGTLFLTFGVKHIVNRYP